MNTTISKFSSIDSLQTVKYSKPKNLPSGKDPQFELSRNIKTTEHLNREKNAGTVSWGTGEQMLNAKSFESQDVVEVGVTSEGVAEYWTEKRMKEAIPPPMSIPGNPTDEEYWTEKRMKEAIPPPMAIPGYPTDVGATVKSRIDTESSDQALTEKSSIEGSSRTLNREKNAGTVDRWTGERVLSAKSLTWYDGAEAGVASDKARLDIVA